MAAKRPQLLRMRIELTFGHADWWLEQQGDSTESAEDFIIRLEDALENEEITLEDVQNMLTDYNGGGT